MIKYLPVIFLFLSLVTAACSPIRIDGGDNSPGESPSDIPTLEVPASPTIPNATPRPSLTPAIINTPSPAATQNAIPTPTETSLACWVRGGRIERSELRTDLLPLPLEYRVYLPPCYAQLQDEHYPVLYLIHGQSFNDDQWDRLGIDEIADRLIADGEISPLIVVMPRDRVWTQPTEDAFGQAVADALLPRIDEEYRTRPDRKFRAVGGLSRGAGWALHLGFSRWESFGAIGMHSLPVFWTDLPHIRTWMDAIPSNAIPRIYIDAPDNDRPQIARSTSWFEELLTEKGIPHEWYLFPGYHDETYWGEHVEDYLRWYTRDW